MPEVFIVYREDDENDEHLVGIFSSKEEALKGIKRFLDTLGDGQQITEVRTCKDGWNFDVQCGYNYMYIETWKLDELFLESLKRRKEIIK